MINEERYLDFIIDNKLTQQQFLLLHLLFKKRWDLIKRYKEVFPTNDGSIIGKDMTQDLIDKGFMAHTIDSKGGIHIKLSKEFIASYTNDAYIADDVYSTYPSFYEDEQGIKYPLTNYDRMSFAKIYQSKINYSQKEHEEILKDIEFGKENNLIKIKIGNFLTSEYWKNLRVLRLEKELENTEIKEDEQDFS